MVARVSAGIPQNSPLCVISHAARQNTGIEGERVGSSSCHGYTGLIKLNNRSSTGAGQIDFEVVRAAVRVVVGANPIHRAAGGRIHSPTGGAASGSAFESSIRG